MRWSWTFTVIFGLFVLSSFFIGDESRKETVYACKGELLERYGGTVHSSSDSIALIVYPDYVKLEGNSYLLFIPNLPKDSDEIRWNTLNICKSSSVTQIEFNSYGCDFESYMPLPSGEVTEGIFNDTLRQLTLTQFRKHKLSATRENDASLREPFHYRRTGTYTCELRRNS